MNTHSNSSSNDLEGSLPSCSGLGSFSDMNSLKSNASLGVCYYCLTLVHGMIIAAVP
jgi:hypothetical protein